MVEAAGESIRISSPGKLLFPKQGWTKLDVVNHFVVVAEGAIRGIFGRPTMLKRYMESVEVNPIYHKRADKNSPFETVEIRFPSQRPGMMIVPRRETDVIKLAQLVVSISPWPARARGHRSPDECGSTSIHSGFDFSHVRRTPRRQEVSYDEVGLRGWPKTSGSRGIHIYMRIVPEWDFYQARRAVLALARELERRHPGLISTKWWKEERTGIFIDYNQMARDKTVSSAYGVRPTGYVSAPLRWEEIPDVSIEDFPLDKFADRYREVGDLTKGIDESAGRLETLLEWVVRDQEEYGQGDAPWPPQYPKVAGEPPSSTFGKRMPTLTRHHPGKRKGRPTRSRSIWPTKSKGREFGMGSSPSLVVWEFQFAAGPRPQRLDAQGPVRGRVHTQRPGNDLATVLASPPSTLESADRSGRGP